jgi:hypothetical protein
MVGERRLRTDLVKEVYGGSLYEQGRGYYPALELFALVWGIEEYDSAQLLEPVIDIRFWRRSHDFARRLLRDTDGFIRELAEDPGTPKPANLETLTILGDLLRGLLVPVPFRRRPPDWYAFHLFPFVGELVHYDSPERRESPDEPKKVPHIERYSYRGGGTLAYELLRTDADSQRLSRTREHLRSLVEPSNSALGRIVSLLHKADHCQPPSETKDDTVIPHSPERDTKWVEELRSGVDNILCSGAPVARQIDQLCHWIAFALASHQCELAHRQLKREINPIPVDVSVGGSLRRESRRRFDLNRRAIWEALISKAGEKAVPSQGTDKEAFAKLADDGYSNWNSNVEGFYSGTLAVVGALSSNFGQRHYTLRPGLLEAIVAATIPEFEEIPFTDFCTEILWKRLGMVVDERSARAADLPAWVDASVFVENARGLEDTLHSGGLMVSLSDATRLVGAQAG